MDLPDRKPSDRDIRAALEAVRDIGRDGTGADHLQASANLLADAALLASDDLERLSGELSAGDTAGAAISSVHEAFLAGAVLKGATILHIDPVLAALFPNRAVRALTDLVAPGGRASRRFALLSLPDGRTPVCVTAPARFALSWPLSTAARAALDAAPDATALLVFLPSGLAQFAGLLQRGFALTAAEARLAAVIADAPTVKDAARRLALSPDTVKERVRDLLAKTGATRRSALAARFTELVAGDYTRTYARADLMREAFGLTRAEARVAEAVAEGLTAPEIATAHGVSRHTVRAQLDGALARTGAPRVSTLARIVAETCALAAWTSSGELYRDDQARIMQATRMVVLPDRRRIAVAEFGPADGQPILHFHPNLCFRAVRRAFAGELGRQGYRSIGYDRAGSGLTDPAPGRHPFEAAAGDAAAVLDALRIDRVRLFAGLGGTAAAIAFATQFPDRVTSAVLLMPRAPSSEPVFAGPIQRIYAGILSVPGTGERFAEALRRTGSSRFWRWLQAYQLQGIPSDAAAARDPAFVAERLAELNASLSRGVRGLYEWEQAYRGGWPRPARIGGKSWTVVETAAQPFRSPLGVQETWGWLPGVRFVRLAGAGRLATQTHAADLAALFDEAPALGSARRAG